MKAWYEEWFDTDYYSMLYHDRNGAEAESFIRLISDYLRIMPDFRILDVGCGLGRHAIVLHSMAREVTGLDLSLKKIMKAKQNEQAGLAFFQHDMRHLFRILYYDLVFNLFTSFGYFDSIYDEMNAARSISANLKRGGRFVMDYLNANTVRENGQGHFEKHIDGVDFHIDKKIEGNWIIKDIQVCTESSCKMYSEKVKLFTSEDIEKLFSPFGLKLVERFGSYELAKYDPINSSRMILIFEKY